MDIRVIGVVIGILYVFGWFVPLGYYDIGSAFGQFFGAFGNNTSDATMNSLSNSAAGMSQRMFGGMQASISGQALGGITYLMFVSGGAFAYFSWNKNKALLTIASLVMLFLAVLLYVNYISQPAWGFYFVLVTAISSIGFVIFSHRAN